MEKVKNAFGNFMWEMIDSALVKDNEHRMLLKKIKCDSEDERLAIVDYGGAIAETAYKAGLRDGLALVQELGVYANE